MKYVLEDLKRVKDLRESASERKLTARKHERESARQKVREKDAELDEYRRFRRAKESALFESVKGKMIGLKDFDQLKTKEKILAEKEAALEQELTRSRTVLETAEQKVKDALAAYQSAVRDTRKMEEHKKLIIEELSLVQEGLEELEIEELHCGSKARPNIS